MKVRVSGRKDVLHAVGQERAIPSGLEKTRVGFVYLFHRINIANIDFVETSPNDRTLSRMSALYVTLSSRLLIAESLKCLPYFSCRS